MTTRTRTRTSTNGKVTHRETVGIEEIDPETAQRWLEGNVDNRVLRESRVVKLGGILQRDEWELTGDAIVFDDQDVLLNGQHRLSAIVVTGIPARLLVLRGVPSKAQEVMDQGLSRNLGDQLHRRGVSYAFVISGGLHWLHQMRYNEATGGAHYVDSAEHPTLRQLLAIHEETAPHLEELAPSINKLRYYTKVRPGPTLALRYRLGQIDETEAQLFFDSWREGTGLAKDDPIFRLREWCMADARFRSTKGRTPAYRYVAYVLVAWNRWRDQVPMRQLTWHFTPSQKDPWPTPH
jgi:hypothetical protein